MRASYPAKVLLFGEHTVLRGGRGLAVPYAAYALRWAKDRPDESLLRFADYLRIALPHYLRTDQLEDWLLADWRLAGNIPTGYGLGSSGAVCAAIFDHFATPAGRALSGEALRDTLARMEQHFHGQSSGTDPLICYLNQPVALGGGQPPHVVSLPAGWNEGFFLFDSGQTRSAGDFIGAFTHRYDTDARLAEQINTSWRAPADAAIDALLAGDRLRLRQQFTLLSAFQRRYFDDFIPPALHDRWSGEGYALKLCGAGGGGMMLGYATHRAGVAAQLGPVAWL